MAKHFFITHAIKDGVTVSIDDVDSGLKCGCVCSACGDPLVAKKGTQRTHHFAHHAGQNCEYGYESSLHLAAKEILSKAKKIVLPPVKIRFPGAYKDLETYRHEKEFEIDRVELEYRLEGIIPDVVVYANNRYFFIEIYVTHSVNEVKLDKIRKAKISTIEIDLSDISEEISSEDLAEILLSNSNKKYWKYHVTAEKYAQELYKVAKVREEVVRDSVSYIVDCPKKARVWKGKSYAKLSNDCFYCPYFMTSKQEAIQKNGKIQYRPTKIWCTGELRISSVQDFRLQTIEERIERQKRAQEEQRNENEKKYVELGKKIEGTKCPNCGEGFIKRNGAFRNYWCCSNYPQCNTLAYPDVQSGEIRYTKK